MKRRHQVNHDLLLLGLPRRKNPVVIWSTAIVAALGLTAALAIPIVAQPADSRQGDVQVSMEAVADYSIGDGPVFVSGDAPLNAFGGSGKELAIDGRPVGMVKDAAESTETSSSSNEESTALLAGTVGELGKLPGDLQLMHPVTSRRISSPYGWRANPTGPGNQIHIGQDYPISCGSPVYASEDGTVTVSGWAGHSGMRVTIDHGYNVQTGYSHNSKLIAKVGQQVKQGELIALAGTTGNSTGCHVHFEVIIDGRWHDPRNYLPLIPGQRQAMIDSQRLTVNANSAPKGNGSQNSGQSNNAPDPDIIVPENNTPHIPAPKPSPTKTTKPSPSQSESESPSASKSPSSSKSPSGSTSPSENESETPSDTPSTSTKPTQKPSPTEAPSQDPSTEGPTGDSSTPPGGSTEESGTEKSTGSDSTKTHSPSGKESTGSTESTGGASSSGSSSTSTDTSASSSGSASLSASITE